MEPRGDERTTAQEHERSVWDELIDDPIMEQTAAEPIRRGFIKTLFGTGYERLGSLILLNLAVTLQLFVGAALGFLIAYVVRANGAVFLGLLIVFGGLFGAPAFAGLFTYVRLICDPDSMSSLRDYVRAMRRYAVRSWILLLLQGVTGLLLWINLRFYAGVHAGVVSLAVEVLILLLALVWAMAGVYAWPLLVRDLRWPLLLRNALFLSLAAPLSSIAILISLGAATLLLTYVTRVLWVFLLFSIWALTETVALQRLVRIFRERQEVTETDAPQEDNS